MDEQTEQDYWNQFAAEYIAIQAESTIPIAQDAAAYLIQQNILPTLHFCDLAGGSGRYLPAFLPHVAEYTLLDFSEKMLANAAQKVPIRKKEQVHLQLETQSSFLATTQTNRVYDVLFSAMNPALNELPLLLEIEKKARRFVVLLRVTNEQDTLLPKLAKLAREPTNPDPTWTWMESYANYLERHGRQTTSKQFDYSWTENLDKSLIVHAYSKQIGAQQLNELLLPYQNEQQEIVIHCHLQWSLLWWPVV